jgi:hypothetical protein
MGLLESRISRVQLAALNTVALYSADPVGLYKLNPVDT